MYISITPFVFFICYLFNSKLHTEAGGEIDKNARRRKVYEENKQKKLLLQREQCQRAPANNNTGLFQCTILLISLSLSSLRQ